MKTHMKACPFCCKRKFKLMRTEDRSQFWVQCYTSGCECMGPHVNVEETNIREDQWSANKEKAALTRWRYTDQRFTCPKCGHWK